MAALNHETHRRSRAVGARLHAHDAWRRKTAPKSHSYVIGRQSRSYSDAREPDAGASDHRWTHAGARGAALRADRVFSAAEAKGGSAIDASKTALLLVEYQNEFTTEGGKLHDAVKESMAATGMLERSAKLADEARNKARRRVVYETSMACPTT